MLLSLYRYIDAVNRSATTTTPQFREGSRVIAMSLYGADPRYTWGAIRNAQLVPIVFPGWRLRVYIPGQINDGIVPVGLDNRSDSQPAPVPARVVTTLRRLGADIARVYVTGNSSTESRSLPTRDWRLLAADDQTLDYFLIRDAFSYHSLHPRPPKSRRSRAD